MPDVLAPPVPEPVVLTEFAPVVGAPVVSVPTPVLIALVEACPLVVSAPLVVVVPELVSPPTVASPVVAVSVLAVAPSSEQLKPPTLMPSILTNKLLIGRCSLLIDPIPQPWQVGACGRPQSAGAHRNGPRKRREGSPRPIEL